MYAGEGDYSEACSAIVHQRGVHIQHLVIANLPEKEAHNRLWHAWRTVQHSGFDMFVKVDADTVLAHNEVLFEFWKMMHANPRITGIQAPLHDYFTNGFINGLNCFSPKVTFRDTADALFCDRQVDVNHDIVIKADGVSAALKPAGRHCHRAHGLQAFHFGVHRKLKNQDDVIQRVRLAWERERQLDGEDFSYDDNRSFALLGALMADRFRNGGFNYTDPQLEAACEEAHARRRELLK